MLLFSICSIKLQLQKVKYSSKQQFPGPNRNTLSRVHCTRVQWWLVYPVSNFDYEQRKVFQRCGSLPIFFANFVTAKWSVNGDVNAADTRAKCLNISVAARKNCIQQFCMVRQAVFYGKRMDSQFKVLPTCMLLTYGFDPVILLRWEALFCHHKMRVGFKCCNMLGKSGMNGTDCVSVSTSCCVTQLCTHIVEFVTFASTLKPTGECLIPMLEYLIWYKLQ